MGTGRVGNPQRSILAPNPVNQNNYGAWDEFTDFRPRRLDGNPDLVLKGVGGNRINVSRRVLKAQQAQAGADMTDKMLQQVRKAEVLRTKLGRTRQSAMSGDTLLGGG